jgi:hypothetical protein
VYRARMLSVPHVFLRSEPEGDWVLGKRRSVLREDKFLSRYPCEWTSPVAALPASSGGLLGGRPSAPEVGQQLPPPTSTWIVPIARLAQRPIDIQ